MKKSLVVILFLFTMNGIYAQTSGSQSDSTAVAIDTTGIVTKPDTMPAPAYNLGAYLTKNVRYPAASKNANIQGTVYVSFVVEKDGSITNVLVVKGVERGDDLSKEALRVFSQMPKWTPGISNGQPVRVLVNERFKFTLM